MAALQLRYGLRSSARCSAARLGRRRSPARRRLQAVTAEHRVTFRVQHRVHYGESVGVLGSSPTLGNWQQDQAVTLHWSDGDVWTGNALFESKDTVEYKYVRLNGEGEVQEWSPGANRVLDFPTLVGRGGLTLDETWTTGSERRKKGAKLKKAGVAAAELGLLHEFNERQEEERNGETRRRGRERPDRLASPPVPLASPSNGGRDVDIGGPSDAPATVYAVEANPILVNIVGVNIKQPAFPSCPW